jgi:hypothetical protein
MTENFLKKDYTAEQAKLKVVWENPHIASICSAMPNMTILQANIDAALNKQRLSENDRQRLEQYAPRSGARILRRVRSYLRISGRPGRPDQRYIALLHVRTRLWQSGYGTEPV